jgi:hypothetical protein
MKERPILFKSDMVRALLDGRKTQTRRICKEPVVDGGTATGCKFGTVGDHLWIKETFCRPEYASGPIYRADIPGPESNARIYEDEDCTCEVKWKPSIFMPRCASRITLEITGVRVERLQDISEDDAIAEGVNGDECQDFDQPLPSMCYQALWESINGSGSWQANPYVWVITFKKVSQL